MEKSAMNVEDLAKTLGISLPKAYSLVRTPNFPCIYLGRRLLIPIAAFEQWLKDSVKSDR